MFDDIGNIKKKAKYFLWFGLCAVERIVEEKRIDEYCRNIIDNLKIE